MFLTEVFTPCISNNGQDNDLHQKGIKYEIKNS